MKKQFNIGWLGLAMGILLILLGVFVILSPVELMIWLVVLCGLVAIITGAADIILYVKMNQYTGFGPTVALVTGILAVMAGFMLVVHPGAGTWAVAVVFPIWIIAHCISRLAHVSVVRSLMGEGYYYYSLVLNILGIVVGVLLLLSPGVMFFSLGFLIGAYLILLGIDCIAGFCNRDKYQW